MYKLIAIDLDGSLLTDKKTITRENLNVLQGLINNGYKIAIATGRNYYSARKLTKEIEGDLVYIVNNGSMVRTSRCNEILFNYFLDKRDFHFIVNEGLKFGLHPIIHVDYYKEDYDIIVCKDHTSEQYYSQYLKHSTRYRFIDSYHDYIFDRILALVYPGTKSDLNNFYGRLVDKYSDRINSHIMENVQIAEAILEVMHPNGNKWTSIKKYALAEGISLDEIIAIGDDNNDIEMLGNSGLGIAMKNGSRAAKSVADIITEQSNNKSGVAFELKRVLNI